MARIIPEMPSKRPISAPQPVPEMDRLGVLSDVITSRRDQLSEEIRKTIAEISNREREGLAIYEPMAIQDAFHRSATRVRLLRGSTRCLAGWQEIHDPVFGGMRRIDEIDGDFHVMSMDPETGEMKVKKACRPFIKGHGAIYQVVMSCGCRLTTTLDHRILSAEGEWVGTRAAAITGCGLAKVCDCQTGESDQPVPVWAPKPRLFESHADREFFSRHPRYLKTRGQKTPLVIASMRYVSDDNIWDFTVEDWSNYECGGVINANSGKTLSAAAEVSRAVLGLDPYKKYPKTGGIVYIAGRDWKHISTVIYPKLFGSSQSVQIIRDSVTDRWRTYRSWDAADVARVSEVEYAGPLIPERFIESMSMEMAALKVPNYVRLTTGWEIYIFSGNSHPPRGQAIDVGWIDEEVENENWYSELASRCVDRNGRIIWSAAPQSGTNQLYDLSQLAEAQRDDPNRVVEEYLCRLSENQHITDAQKAERLAMATTDAERITMIEGDFLVSSQRVFPHFSLKQHGVPWMSPPDDWTRYLVIDPGHQVAAALFFCIPPPDHPLADTWIIYDEVYVVKASADSFADVIRGKVVNQRFEDFIIDKHGSSPTEAGSGMSIFDQYNRAFQERNIRCLARGASLVQASSGQRVRIRDTNNVVRGMLAGNHPRMRVMTMLEPNGQLTCCAPNLEYEIARYRFKKDGDRVTDEPDERGRVHTMSILRFAVQFGLKYTHRAPSETTGHSPIYAAYLRQKDRERDNRKYKPLTFEAAGEST